MKKIIYFFASLFVVLSIQSCKRMGDDDGNLLNNMGVNNNLLGEDRFLYQEVTSSDTIAFYQYTGRKLTSVIGNDAITKISYSGDLINKIEYNGLVNGDSIAYVQLFNYNPANNNILSNITETRSVYIDIDNQTPPLVADKTKSIYEITFDNKGKLSSVLKKTGNDIPLTTFAFTTYEKTNYTYDALKNVSNAEIFYGGVSGGAIDPPSNKIAFEFANYDENRSPYTLIPFGYLLHKSFENPSYNYRFSPNNPKRIILTGDLIAVPITFNTLYTYDHLKYALTGWVQYYEYRPF